MTTLRHTLRQRLASPWWIGALAAAVMLGCGGGDGGSSTAGNGVGTGGTGAAAGPVTGYGSLIVNNTRFDVDALREFDNDDGERVSITDRVQPVGLGTTVDIRSGAITRNSDDDDVAKATTVTVISAIKGLVEVAPSGNSLVVLGQAVKVNEATQYGTANRVLSDLTLNTPVVVYGYQEATGAYLATRIETLASPPQLYKLRGRVTSVGSSVSRRFKMGEVNGVGGITVDTTALTLGSLPALGSTVVVRLNTLPSATGVYRAVLPLNTVDRTPTEATRSGIEGIVSGYTPGNQAFKVDGVAVLITNNTQVTGTLADNRRVSVEGNVVNRVLVATKVTVRADDGDDLASSYKLIDRLNTLSTSSNTFVLKNLTVHYDASTRIEGCRTSPCSESDLQGDPYVEVEGRPTSTGFTATRIRLRLLRG